VLDDNPKRVTDWSAEDVEKLARLRGEGRSAIEISREIGKTRDAILGKARRLGLPLAPGVEPRWNPNTPKHKNGKNRKRRRRPKPKLTLQHQPLYAGPVPLLDRKDDQCPDILDVRAPNGLAMVCARTRAPKSVWCAQHRAQYVTLMSSNRG
jgi:hypothetical protein